MPTYGQTVYATLGSLIGWVWQWAYYTYTEAGTPVPAALTSPTPGSTLPGSSVTFAWTGGAGPAEYLLCLGTTGVGSWNLYHSILDDGNHCDRERSAHQRGEGVCAALSADRWKVATYRLHLHRIGHVRLDRGNGHGHPHRAIAHS